MMLMVLMIIMITKGKEEELEEGSAWTNERSIAT
jgi:hypothetical protein